MKKIALVGFGATRELLVTLQSLTLSQKLMNNISVFQLASKCVCEMKQKKSWTERLSVVQALVSVKSTGIASKTEMTQKDRTHSCTDVRMARKQLSSHQSPHSFTLSV